MKVGVGVPLAHEGFIDEDAVAPDERQGARVGVAAQRSHATASAAREFVHPCERSLGMKARALLDFGRIDARQAQPPGFSALVVRPAGVSVVAGFDEEPQLLWGDLGARGEVPFGDERIEQRQRPQRRMGEAFGRIESHSWAYANRRPPRFTALFPWQKCG